MQSITTAELKTLILNLVFDDQVIFIGTGTAPLPDGPANRDGKVAVIRRFIPFAVDLPVGVDDLFSLSRIHRQPGVAGANRVVQIARSRVAAR